VYPAFTPPDSALLVATPAVLTVATPVLEDVHVALSVRFCVLPSLKCPVAVKVCVALLSAITGFCGLTTSTCSDAVPEVTVSVVEPVMPAETALITLVPAATPVANPPAVIVATVVVTELQVAVPVKFCVELSENVPVAVNCSVVVFAIEGFAGVTAMDTSVATVTVRVVEPVIPPETA
jgi:hypothetical protein